MFVANLAKPSTPPSPGMPGAADYIGFVDNGARDLGAMVGITHNAATNTFERHRAACRSSLYTSLHAPLRLNGTRRHLSRFAVSQMCEEEPSGHATST